MHTPRRPGIAAATVAGLILSALTFGSAPASAATTPAPPPVTAPPVTVGEDPIAHDPTMIKSGDYYYVVITGDAGVDNTYLPMKRSKDLKTWEELGPVFSAAPEWIPATLGVTPRDFWAPELTYSNGLYHLYYAASQFGVNNSVIGLATTASLDPASPDFGWTDEGVVLRSVPGDDFNAIDPEVTEADGRTWLAYGSFWSGIYIRELDAATGKLAASSVPTHLIDRQWAPNAVEAPAITKHGDYYYLFSSFDYCCRGENAEYRTMVGRSTSITGPYVDESGQPLLSGGGTELLRGYNEFSGPGGGDLVQDGDVTRYVHHYYDLDDDTRPKLSVRTLQWGADGWPTLSEPVNPSRSIGHGPAYFQIVEKTGGSAIGTVPGGPAAPLCGYEGADVRLLAADSNPCTSWRFEPREAGYQSIRNLQTNKVFDTAFCGFDDGTNLAQWGWLNNDCQQFRFVPTTDGFVSLQNKVQLNGLAGKFVDAGAAVAGSCATGSDVTIFSASADRCQQFRLQPTGPVLLAGADGAAVGGTATAPTTWTFTNTTSGYYRISSGAGTQLPVRACEARDAAVQTGLRHAARAKALLISNPRLRALALRAAALLTPALDACTEWKLEPQNDGTYRIIDRATGYALTDAAQANTLDLTPASAAATQRFSILAP